MDRFEQRQPPPQPQFSVSSNLRDFELACLSQEILRSQQCALGFELQAWQEETSSSILNRLLALAGLLRLDFRLRENIPVKDFGLFEDMKFYINTVLEDRTRELWGSSHRPLLLKQ